MARMTSVSLLMAMGIVVASFAFGCGSSDAESGGTGATTGAGGSGSGGTGGTGTGGSGGVSSGVVWQKDFQVPSDAWVAKVGMREDGGVLVAGSFAGTFDVGAGAVTSTAREAAFLAGFDGSGTAIYTVLVGEDCEDDGEVKVSALQLDTAGNAYVMVEDECSPEGDALLKVNPQGQIVWTKRISGASALRAYPSGDLVVTTNWTVSIDGSPVTGTADGLGALVKMDGDAKVVWVTPNGAGCDSGSISLDEAEKVYVVRALSGDQGAISCDGKELVGAGDPLGHFVTTYGPSGESVSTWGVSLPEGEPTVPQDYSIKSILALSSDTIILRVGWSIYLGETPPYDDYMEGLLAVDPSGSVKWWNVLDDSDAVYPQVFMAGLLNNRLFAMLRDPYGDFVNMAVFEANGEASWESQRPKCYSYTGKGDEHNDNNGHAASNSKGQLALAAVYEGACSPLADLGAAELPAHEPAGLFVAVVAP